MAREFAARTERKSVRLESTITYDSNGNTTSKTDSTGTTQYAWDFENRLTSVTLPGTGGTVSFKYDPFGRRIYKSSSSGTSIYAYDGDNVVEEVNSSGVVVARYAQTADRLDEPVAMLRSSATSYYHADALGSITSLSNAAGSLAQTYTYDSFGKPTGSTGSLVNALRFTGREFAGLEQTRASAEPSSGAEATNARRTSAAGRAEDSFKLAQSFHSRSILRLEKVRAPVSEWTRQEDSTSGDLLAIRG